MNFGCGRLQVLARCGCLRPVAGAVGSLPAVLVGALLLPSGQALAVDSSNQLRPWTDYRVIMWVGDSALKKPEKMPLFLERLRGMGINTAMVYGDASPQPYLEGHFPYYVENMINRGLCLKWNSKVRDWDKFISGWMRNGRSESAFIREYCLDDPQWRGWARNETQRIVRRHRDHAPLAYDIRDELSVTISANPFDYDFNPITLAKFRGWLRTQYRDLGALNAEWETKFPSWDEVRPFTTDQIKNRMTSGTALPQGQPDWGALQGLRFDPGDARRQPTRWNFSPWCDFRTYMDTSLAGTLDEIRQAAQGLDPHTPVGIEGTQMPHPFGGYDLWRLSQVLDWVEPYDIGNAREIFGSFMPGKTILTTVFEKDTDHARRRLWHLLLEGDRGCIIWWSEDCIDWKSDDYALTPKALALAPALKELASPLARLFMLAEKERDPIGLVYSQASIQVGWLLESTVDGSTWPRRFSSFESDHNRMAKVRNSWLKAFQDLGYSPRFVSTAQLETRGLADFTVLVRVNHLATSEREQEKIQAAQRARSRPFTVFSDGSAGWFDPHGRLRPARVATDGGPPEATSEQSSFAAWNGMPGDVAAHDGDVAGYARDRLFANPRLEWAEWIAKQVRLAREVTLPPGARTRIHRYRVGPARLLAFERNIDYHMSEELIQAGGNEALEKPVDLEASLAGSAHVFDLRARKYLGQTDHVHFTLDPWQPTLLALLPEKIEAQEVVARLLRTVERLGPKR